MWRPSIKHIGRSVEGSSHVEAERSIMDGQWNVEILRQAASVDRRDDRRHHTLILAWPGFVSSKGNSTTQPQIGIMEGSCTPEQSASKSNETGGLLSLIVAFLMTVVAFLGPFAVIISEAYFSITAVAWNANVSITGVYFYWMSPAQWFMSLPITVLRFYYVYQMKLLYDGKTTQKHALRFGILSECPPLIFGIVTSLPLLFIPGYLYAFMPIPIPELLLIGLIFMKVIPPPKEPLSWIEKQDEPL